MSNKFFFADVTLDLEMAHDIVTDSPTVPTQPSTLATSMPTIPTLAHYGSHGRKSDPSEDVNSTSNIEGSNWNDREFIRISGGNNKEVLQTSFRALKMNETQYSHSPSWDNTIPRRQSRLHRPIQKILQRRQEILRRVRSMNDYQWALVAIVGIPSAIILPLLLYHPSSDNRSISISKRATWACVAALILTLLTSVGFTRLLYHSKGGGTVGQVDGDQARHIAAAILFAITPLSTVILPLILIATRYVTGNRILFRFDYIWIWLVIIFTLRQISIYCRKIWLVRRYRPQTVSSPSSVSSNRSEESGAVKTTSDIDVSSAGRRILFKQLTVAALDILSRSLGHKSFVRCVTAVLCLQFLLAVAWQASFFRVLTFPVSSTQSDHSVTSGFFLLFVLLLASMWATGVLSRLLGLIASGGVTLWVEAQHQMILEQLEQEKSLEVAIDDVESEVKTADSHFMNFLIPADQTRHMNTHQNQSNTNVYLPVSYLDDESDDDDDYNYNADDDDKLEDNDASIGTHHPSRRLQVNVESPLSMDSRFEDFFAFDRLNRNGTLRSILKSGLTVSAGSVTLCALTGSTSSFLTQLLWNIDCFRHRFETSRDEVPIQEIEGRFRLMKVRTVDDVHQSYNCWNVSCLLEGKETFMLLMTKLETRARSFVRYNSDLGLGLVAAHMKSYRTASNDARTGLDQAGMMLLCYDDISSYVCSAVSLVLSGLCTITASAFLSTTVSTSADNSNIDTVLIQLPDSAQCCAIFVTFFLSYLLCDTLMEPLRASIRSIYVSFSFHPLGLSQAFPLLFYRLQRMSDPQVD